ncbi:unnamed protein product [Cyberlindnera jadinii]|uniref:Uncharacterized protein n=1 Tax=Cyberlindnera jadinii (strain ATCC 18201 / CBS 1600 / BCRC 20928 / JCM 3617 / NBRC 0987 / NRRL Y-1542) TaxID=983966 RepID=A0A0H5CH16_CYBJN|nr:unnamed protein product [Cyberlindnera jadinii]
MSLGAAAAAQASTPAMRGGILLDGYDARIVEFQCGMRKLQVLQTHLRALAIKVKAGKGESVPLIHYIVTLATGATQVNDQLRKRLESVNRLECLRDRRKLVPHVNTSPVSVDLEDSSEPVCPYTSDADYAQLLDDLTLIAENGVAIYQEKLKQSLTERDVARKPDATHRPIPLDFSSFADVIEPLEVMTLSQFVRGAEETGIQKLKSTRAFLDAVEKTTKNIGSYVDVVVKTKAKLTEASIQRLPSWAYTLHRIVASIFKLSELYAILRRFGRELYIPRKQDFHSAKLLHKNTKWQNILNECEEYLVNSKKNELMLLVLSKVTRSGSQFPLKASTIQEMIPPLNHSYNLVIKLISVLRDLLKGWEEVGFSEQPTQLKASTSKKLTVLFKPDKGKQPKETTAAQQRDKERAFTTERNNQQGTSTKVRAGSLTTATTNQLVRSASVAATRARAGSNPPIMCTSPFSTTARSRSGSNASVASSSSTSSQLNSLRENCTTASRSTQESPTVLSRTPSNQRRARPQSVYSNAAFDIRTQLRRQEKLKANTPSPPTESPKPNGSATRLKRSSSLQQPPNSIRKATMVNAAAAGALLSQTEKQTTVLRHSSLKSPAELAKSKNSSPENRQPSPPKHRLTANGTQRILPTDQMKTVVESNDIPNLSELKISSSTRSDTSTSSRGSSNSTPRVIPKASQKVRTVISPKVTSKSTPKVISRTTQKETPESTSNSTPTVLSPPKSPELTPATVIMKRDDSTDSSGSIQPTPETLTPTVTNEDYDITPTKSNSKIDFYPDLMPLKPSESPSAKPMNKSIPSGEASSTPELVESSTASESSLEDEPPEPKKITKRVRFIGVPPLLPEPKPKRKGWAHPPSTLSIQKARTGLSVAAAALQQERMAFSRSKQGGFGAFDNSTNASDRMMSSITASSSQKRWRIGGKLRDRF